MAQVFSGTAAELAELTREHWGSEWWPKGLEFREYCWDERWADGLHVESAASIIFAAAMVHLAEKGLKPLCDTHDTGTPEWRVASGSCVRRSCIAPSPLHAVLAAIKATA